MLRHDALGLGEQIPIAAAALPLFPPSASGWRFSLPLPLFEPGVLLRVVPCTYYPISKSRWPFAFGSLKGRTQLPLGVVATRTARGAGQLLVVRDALSGTSATGDAATWGMEAWARSERDLAGLPPRAYRWVGEMLQIADTFDDAGLDGSLFRGAAAVYETVAALEGEGGIPATREGLAAALAPHPHDDSEVTD